MTNKACIDVIISFMVHRKRGHNKSTSTFDQAIVLTFIVTHLLFYRHLKPGAASPRQFRALAKNLLSAADVFLEHKG